MEEFLKRLIEQSEWSKKQKQKIEDLEKINKMIEPDKLIKQFGMWAVTTYGLELLNRIPTWYFISSKRILEDDPNSEYNFVNHIFKKIPEKFFPEDFEEAYNYLKKQTYMQVSKGLRFDILKRDNYACQICGKTQDDGVKLEVDHIIPKSKGGSNNKTNLQILCFECNRGKTNKDE